MTREDVLKTVTHTGDCYRIKVSNLPEPFNFYVSRIGDLFLYQEGSDLPFKTVSFISIEWVERY